MMQTEEHDGVVVARITGDIDMANTPTIEQALAVDVKSTHRGFVVDLTEVTYLDSAGIRMLYQLDERASGRQQQLAIVLVPGGPVNRTLEAAGALGSLKIVSTVAEGVDLIAS